MPHPLEHLNGKRKYLCTNQGEKFYLRAITNRVELERCAGEPRNSWQEMEEKPDLRYLLGPIERRSVERVQSRLQANEIVISSIPPRDPEQKYTATTNGFKGMMDRFDNDAANGATIFVVEDENGNPVSAMRVNINDPQQRVDMKVDPEVKTFILLSDVGTAPNYEGKGLLASAFDEILTTVTDPAVGLQRPFQFGVSMIAVTIVHQDKSETKHVMNSDLYAGMWKKRFLDVELQNRWQLNGAQVGLGKMQLDGFLKQDGSCSPQLMDNLIKAQEDFAKVNGASVRGLYFNGAAKSYEDNKVMVDNLRQARDERVGTFYDQEQDKGWRGLSSTPHHASAAVVVSSDLDHALPK